MEENIARQVAQSGGVLPKQIKNAPELLPGLELYYNAFFALTNERTLTEFALQSIPWSKIVEYGQYYEFDNTQIEILVYLVGKMDSAYLDRIRVKK